MGAGGADSLRNCIARAECGAVGDWAVHAACRGESGDCSRGRSLRFIDPVLKTPVHWEALHTFNPAAIVRDGKVYVLYRAEDDSGAMEIGGHTSRLGLAESEDGIHFTRRAEPVFYPAEDEQKAREWPGGVEDPRIVGARRRHVRADVHAVESRDLLGGHCHVARSAALDQVRACFSAPRRAANMRSCKYKSAGIVTRLDQKGRLIAAKIDGKYWMYWGEGAIRLATSADLIHWSPVEDEHGQRRGVAAAAAGPLRQHVSRDGAAAGSDERGDRGALQRQECGRPGAIRTLGPNAYAAGEALFDAENPGASADADGASRC